MKSILHRLWDEHPYLAHVIIVVVIGGIFLIAQFMLANNASTSPESPERNGPVQTETSCSDGNDNDNDGLVDCEDINECSYSPACAENCGNGVDDDEDGSTDCADAWCAEDPAC